MIAPLFLLLPYMIFKVMIEKKLFKISISYCYLYKLIEFLISAHKLTCINVRFISNH